MSSTIDKPPSASCRAYQAQTCRSCRWLDKPYTQQLFDKQQQVEQLVPLAQAKQWPIYASAEFGFRNKAKMVVSGTWQAPILGRVDASFQAFDLTDCPLYPDAIQQAFTPIKAWIRQLKLMPYNIVSRRGELKYVLITIDEQTGYMMLRFVLRSQQYVGLMRRHLAELQQQLPAAHVVSVNIQPLAAAIIEGEQEIMLTEQATLTHWLNGLPLHCHPHSFFQTNTAVAAALYRQAQTWIQQLQPKQFCDLFCGVGGFALHAAQVMQGEVIGIEINADAIASAQLSADTLGLSDRLTFRASTADEFAVGNQQQADCILVNPPRRGIGAALCAWLNEGNCQWLIYSSCNPVSLAQDLARLTEFTLQESQVFDMFAHSEHAEVLILLKRTDESKNASHSLT